MDYEIHDVNGSDSYFSGPGVDRWGELHAALDSLVLQLQASDQRGRVGKAIFDPKASNAALTNAATRFGWSNVRLPADLRSFGNDWDSGKGAVLGEWQFSNYPFLWNNITRTEIIYRSGVTLPSMSHPVQALIVVTKSGTLPASNSTLYFEQARAQIEKVATLGIFTIPIRLIGLTVSGQPSQIECDWNSYSGRYSRQPHQIERVVAAVTVGKALHYGHHGLTFTRNEPLTE